ncbi:AAA family ATPase [Nocardia sp. NPDC051981]|uniref:helix-turn-helix transcriptional regulator n=1 Tax=Nocardia sp. NPDC051981 TaxID=3155417 RepID=UPI00343ECFE7
MSGTGSFGTPGMVNRWREREVLKGLVAAVRTGTSRVLVVRGEPGIGKTLLLEHAAELAEGFRTARVTGMQSEMELPFAGLHQLCAPMLAQLDALTTPQQHALRVAFGLADGLAPNRSLVGLAVLGLLAEVSRKSPLLCLIDDHQWLDQESAQTLGFVARRLDADPVGMVFATRDPGADLGGLTELPVTGLHDEDARNLLDSVLTGPLDRRVREQILAETGGNPLALVELPRSLTPARLAAGFGLPGVMPVPERIEANFREQLEALPARSRRLLLLAAADPSGDVSLIRRAAERSSIPFEDAATAAAGLAEFDGRVRFRHPLLRSAAYRSISPEDRQAAHLALAEATDPVADADRRAWHRAHSAAGPNEDIAADLERSAERARARGGQAAATAFLQRAVLMSVDPVRRVERILAAADSALQAGAFGTATDLLAMADMTVHDDLQAARIELLRAHIRFASGLSGDAPPLLLAAARRLEPLDRDLACDTYLTAWMSAIFAGRYATGAGIVEISTAAQELPPQVAGPDLPGSILSALTEWVTAGPAAAAPALRRIVDTFSDTEIDTAERLRWGWFAQATASALWDLGEWRTLLTRQVRLAREVGALDQLPVTLGALGVATAWAGDFQAAATLVTESDTISEATGTQAAQFSAVILAAMRGSEDDAARLIETTATAARAQGQGAAEACANWAGSILNNGLCRYDRALTMASEAALDAPGLYISLWALPELIEAATRTGDPKAARAAFDQLARSTQATRTDLGLGIEARSRALLSSGPEAEELYREAIDRLGRTGMRADFARARLLFGEWLRRENRRQDARTELRAAHDLLSGIGMTAFAERAGRELLACGERARKRTVDSGGTLTDQEALIARLAAEGRTNPDIAELMFISARTVEWHLRKVFGKLGIGSRRELKAALAVLDPRME